MPSLIDLRRRIRAVKNTQQITKAMKTVSASKLRKAQERIVGARPFAREMLRVLNGLASRIDSTAHPLLASPDPDSTAPVLLVVVTADKGLCGGFNSALLRKSATYIRDADGPVALVLVGRKGRDFFRRHSVDVRYEDVNIFNDLRYIPCTGRCGGCGSTVHRGLGVQRAAPVQRVQERHPAGRRRRPTPPNSSAHPERDGVRGTGRVSVRAESRTESSTRSCRAT